jgi:hypothetical protein
VANFIVAVIADNQCRVVLTTITALIANICEIRHAVWIVWVESLFLRLDSQTFNDFFLYDSGTIPVRFPNVAESVQTLRSHFTERTAVGDLGPLFDAFKAKGMTATTQFCPFNSFSQTDHAFHRFLFRFYPDRFLLFFDFLAFAFV